MPMSILIAQARAKCGPGLVMVLSGGMFAENSRAKWLLWDVLCTFRLRRRAESAGLGHGLGRRHFCWGLVEILVKPSLVQKKDLVKTLLKSSKRSLSDVAQVLMRRWTGHPGEVLSKSYFHDLVQAHMCPCMILYRFLWEDLAEILFKSSLRGPCIKILKMLWNWGACM